MPRGPQGQQRPRDVVGAAVRVARIATQEEQEIIETRTAGQILGRSGGRARARKLTAAQRTAIAKQGAAARWARKQADVSDLGG